jgi:hypothetical protein
MTVYHRIHWCSISRESIEARRNCKPRQRPARANWHFSSGFEFEFGSRSRDYGSMPTSIPELQAWFAAALKSAEGHAVSTAPVAAQVRAIIAKKFRGLWTKAGLYDDLERVCRAIRKEGFWRDGWIGVKETLRFDAKAMGPQAKARLEAIEKLLRPASLVQKVRSLVLARHSGDLELDDFDIEDDDGAATMLQRRDAIAIALGKESAKDSDAFEELLPELTSGNGLLWMFGKGLALGADDPDALWSALTAQFAATPEGARNSLVLNGFLEGLNKKDPKRVASLLDAALTDKVLRTYFPSLQQAVPIDKQGVARLMQAIETAPAWQFKVLAGGRAADPIPGSDLRALLRAIAGKPDGFLVAAEILDMRLFSDKGQQKAIDPELFAAGRDLLEMMEFGGEVRDGDHVVGTLAARCLKGGDGVKTAQRLCRRIIQAVSVNEIRAYRHDELIGNLFQVQPTVVLDEWFGGSEADQEIGQKIIEAVVQMERVNPLDKVPQDQIFAWCEARRPERYPIMASLITLFRPGSETNSLEWSDAARMLLDRAPDRLAVLKQYVRRFRPTSWSGSLAAVMEAPLAPLRKLEQCQDPAVAAFAKSRENPVRARSGCGSA